MRCTAPEINDKFARDDRNIKNNFKNGNYKCPQIVLRSI